MAAILLGDRRLTDLKVTELKAELDKRGLPKKGVKSVLVERLKKAILREELSNVKDEEDEGSGEDTAADTSLASQDEVEAAGESSAEVAVPAADAVNVPPDGTSVAGPVIGDLPKEPTVEVTESISAVAAEKVPHQREYGADHDLTPPLDIVAREVVMVTMETAADSVVKDDREEEDKGQSNQPMELGSPLDSDPEFDLLPGEQEDSMEMIAKGGETSGTEHQEARPKKYASEEVKEEREGEEKEDGDEEAKAGAEAIGKRKEEKKEVAGKRVERLDSTFDSSYEPATEELLYEGDPEMDVRQETGEPSEERPAGEDERSTSLGEGGEKMADTSGTEKREEEVAFMVEVHYKDQGGILEDPAATVIGPASSTRDEAREKGGKRSPVSGGKTTGDSTRLSGCHLWVAGLVGSVRALDLQTLFSSFGQVLSAKVVAKAQSKARFGYVTLATREQAQKCISKLSGTELKGSTIHVELAKTPPPLSQMSSGEKKSPLSHRISAAGPSRGKEGGAKNGHDIRDKDKVGQAITRKSPGLGGGEGKGGAKVAGDRGRDDRRRSTGSTRYHGDERPAHSRRSRSPPLRRSPRGGRPRGGRTSPSPRSSGSYGSSSSLRGPVSRDARDDIIRREEQRRDLMERRLGADPYYRDGSRQVMMDERRFADRYQEMAARRQMEVEQSRREQEMARRMQEIREREAREREIRERQMAEQERVFKERERAMREREYRERQRREQLEKELRERDQREKELRERERRLREQHMRELQERELKVARERELREREAQARVQRERELQEKEQRLLQEHQRIQKEKQLYEEQQRRLREEAERQAREREAREREAREREVRERDRKMEAERERRLREEKERERERRERERAAEEERLQLERAAKLEREREQKRKQEELKWERESRMLQNQRLGKRGGGYQDSVGYDVTKRQAVHDIRGSSGGIRGAAGSGGGGGRGGMDMYDLPSSVFSRLDQQKQVGAQGRIGQVSGGLPNVSAMIQASSSGGGGKSSGVADSFNRRGGSGESGGVGAGGYRPGGYGVGGGMGRERHMDGGVSYPIPSINKSGQNSSPGYQKSSATIGGGVTVLQKGGLSRQNQDIISAALANIQKSVSPSSSVANQMRMQGSSPIQQQISPAAHLSAGGMGDFPVGGQVPQMGGVTRQMMGGGGMGPMGKAPAKLPPEGERYNRRFSRPSHGPRQGNVKRF